MSSYYIDKAGRRVISGGIVTPVWSSGADGWQHCDTCGNEWRGGGKCIYCAWWQRCGRWWQMVVSGDK